MITCCYGCTHRMIGCHVTCKLYIKEKEDTDLQKDRIKQAKEKENNFSAYHKDKVYRATRRGR